MELQYQRKKEINSTRTGKDFLHLFYEILQVKIENINKKHQFISEEKNEDKEIEAITGELKNPTIKYKDLKNNPVNVLFKD